MKRVLHFITAIIISCSTIVNAETVTFTVESSSHEKLCKDFQTEVTKNDDGTYTIADFFNSGSPLSISISDEPRSDGKYFLDIASDAYRSGAVVFPYDKNGAFMDFKMIDENDVTTSLSNCYIYLDYYSYATKWTSSDGSPMTSFVFCTQGRTSSGTTPFMFVGFSWKESSMAGIEEVADCDASEPVEFFNLQGVKVANPENGIFIRKQGKKVQKMIVR